MTKDAAGTAAATSPTAAKEARIAAASRAASDPVVAEGMRKAQLAARRRASYPDRIFHPKFDPARQIGSPLKRGRTDVFDKMRTRSIEAAKRGPAAFRPDVASSVAGEDTVRVAILRVDFRSDREGSNSSGDGRFEMQPRDTVNRPLDPTPHNRAFFQSHGEALRRYYDAQTAGRAVLEFTVYPSASDSAFHLSDMADYGPWKFSTEIYAAAVELFHDCIVAADTTESIPWGTFDRVCIIHAGSDLQSDVNQDSPLDIPTFTIGVADSDAVAVGPAKTDTVFAAIIGPESIRQDGFEGTINAVYAHEFGHLVFGWRDVYDVYSGLPTVGYWSLMDTGNLLGNAVTFPNGSSAYAVGILPPSVDPYQKRLVYDDVPLAPLATFGAEDVVGNSAQSYAVLRVPISGEEYLLLENRLDDLNQNGQLTITRDPNTGVILGPADEDAGEYDFLVPGPGMIAWHIDESVADFFTPGPRADVNFALNGRRDRFGLEVIEADGLDDLGDFNSPFALGWLTDPWFVGNKTRLNATTTPKLLTNSNTDPHLDIEFTSIPGPEMTVKVTRLWDRAGWPVRATQPPSGITPVVGRLGAGTEPVVAWAGGDSALHVRTMAGEPLAGAADDVVFKATRALRPVALVNSLQDYGPYLAVAEEGVDAPGDSARVHLVRFEDPQAPDVETIRVPAAVTAGPASDFEDWFFLGLADGRVFHVVSAVAAGHAHRTTPGGARTLHHDPALLFERGSIGSGEVTGLAVLGDRTAEGALVAAAGRTPSLWSGFFYAEDLDATQTWSKDVLATGHVQQPMLFLVQSGSAAVPRAAVVDRTVGSLVTSDPTSNDSAPIVPYQGHALNEPVNAPGLDDTDGDLLPEVVFTTESGRVGYWNLNGATSPGWPPEVEKEGFATGAGPLTVRMPASNSTPLVVASLGNGILTALDAKQKPAAGFPLGLSVGARGTPAIANPGGPGPATLVVAGGDTLLYAIDLGGSGAGGESKWSHEGGSPGRGYSSPDPFGVGIIDEGGQPIVANTLKCYPNPAQRSPITFAFRLARAAPVRVKIYDSAARQVDAFERAGTSSDNAITWDPSGRTSGLYVARIEVEGQVLTAPFAIVR